MMLKSSVAASVAIACLAVIAVPACARGHLSVTRLSVSPATFVIDGSNSQGGTTIRYDLSKDAQVRIVIARRLRGRIAGHRCVEPTAQLSSHRVCTRLTLVGDLVNERQDAGRHTVAFNGRIGGDSLAPGHYRATLVASTGGHSRRRIVNFTVVRGRAGGTTPGSTTPSKTQTPGSSTTTTTPPSTVTPPPTPGSSGDLSQFPNESTTGTPAGWVPTTTRSTDMDVNTPGAVVQNVRFTNGAKLNINAPNVTVQDVELQGGWIDTSGENTLIQDTTIDRLAPETDGGEGVISYCGYTAVRVKILDRNEGFRESGCDPGVATTIKDSFVRITPPDSCENGSNTDWHGDGIQGYYGTDLIVQNVTIDFHEDAKCQATSPFFYNGGSGGSPNGHAFINGLLLKGGGYSFRLGTPAPNSVQGLRIVNKSWRYAPIDITTVDGGGCSAISPWEAKLVTVDSNWKVTSTVGNLPCQNDNG